MSRRRIRVAVFNDSRTSRAALRAGLAHAEDIEIVAEAADGRDAAKIVEDSHADVVLMDVVMPTVDGYEATTNIMQRRPTPIVMMSAVVNPKERDVIFEALHAGALYVEAQLPPPSDPSYELRCRGLAELLRTMASASVDRARKDVRHATLPPPAEGGIAIIGIVASAGGPPAVLRIAHDLPRGRLPPIVIVQHLTPGFAPGFAGWLSERTGHSVEIPRSGDCAKRGTIYIAGDDRHLLVDESSTFIIRDDPPVDQFRPSGTVLIRSLSVFGARAVAVILSGMGEDGIDGALALRAAGGQVIAQDESTSAIYGMPRVALERGAASEVLPLEEISQWLLSRCTAA